VGHGNHSGKDQILTQEWREKAVLEARQVYLSYGEMQVLRDVSLRIRQGEIVSLIGANAAGKSSMLNAVSSLVPICGGEIHFERKRIDSLPSHEIIELGIIQVPEGRRVFHFMTVKENLLMGGYNRRAREKNRQSLQRVYELFPRLAEREKQMGESMSGGEQQMLAIGRALMSKPRLLLLDEPSLGLAPIMVKEVGRIILDINQRKVGMILVEQNAQMALRLAQKGYVLETGSIALEGKTSELIDSEHVKKAYLGG
jgi:branched-chain amino acid transport system ATP-binding protein